MAEAAGHILDRLKNWAGNLKRDVIALYIAARDPRTPALAKLMAFLLAAYALSPIDFIPDFIPVLGYLDDLLLLPAGIALVLRLIPKGLMAEFRAKADEMAKRPVSWPVAIVICVLWIVALVWLFETLS